MSQANEPSEEAADGAGSRPIEQEIVRCDRGLAAGQIALIARIERVPATIRAEQLERDRDDLRLMQLENFNGRTWDRRQRDLFQYGHTVLPKKIRTGEIFAIMRDVGIPAARDLGLPTGPSLTLDEVDEITADVTVAALIDFKRLLMEGVWDPYREQVASMRTFYIGKCAIEFRAPWRRMLRRRKNRLEEERQRVLQLEDGTDKLARPDSIAIARLEIARVLAAVRDRDAQKLIVLDAFGLCDQEIADRLGLTRKQVEYRLKKTRQLLGTFRDAADGVA